MQPADYARIEKAILYLEKNFRRQPSLREVARTAGLSEYHFHRLFTRWAGISPKRFLQFLTAEYARRLLRESPNVLDAAYKAGLSGPGRLHDLIVNIYAVTPGELKEEGAGLTIRYGVHSSPFGECIVWPCSSRGPISRSRCGRRLSASRRDARLLTRTSPLASARPGPCAPSAPPSPGTRWDFSFPATVSSGRPGPSGITIGGRPGRRRSLPGKLRNSAIRQKRERAFRPA